MPTYYLHPPLHLGKLLAEMQDLELHQQMPQQEQKIRESTVNLLLLYKTPFARNCLLSIDVFLSPIDFSIKLNNQEFAHKKFFHFCQSHSKNKIPYIVLSCSKIRRLVHSQILDSHLHLISVSYSPF